MTYNETHEEYLKIIQQIKLETDQKKKKELIRQKDYLLDQLRSY